MSAGLLFLLLSKMESKAMMMKFDKLYLNKVDDESAYKRKEKFFHYNQYKAALFSSRPSFILHLIEIFSILILKWIYATHKIIFTKIKTKKFVESLKKDMCYSVFDDFRIDKK